MDNKIILIEGAMDEEISLIHDSLSNVEELNFYGYSVTKGEYLDNTILLCKTEMGMVNAAFITSILIKEFNPQYVFNQGTSGGHKDFLNVGDIVLGDFYCNINSYKTAYLPKGKGSNPLHWEPWLCEIKDNDKFILSNGLKASTFLVSLAKNTFYNGNKYVGTIGSGDFWNNEIDRINMISNIFDSYCEEMETYAVAQVCNNMNVPFLGFRIISNNAVNGGEYDLSTAYKCQEFALELLKNIKNI